MAYHPLHIIRGNIEALRIALGWKEGDRLSGDQVQALQRYAGFGGIKAVLFPAGDVEEWQKLNASEADIKLHPQVMELHGLLQQNLNAADYKQAVDAMKASVLTAFYTPAFVPRVLYDTLKSYGLSPERTYEPSAGAGVFVSEAAKAFRGVEQVTAVEKDILTGRVLLAIAGNLGVNSTVHIKGFEETPINDNNSYDLVISNIPFGNFRVFDKDIQAQALTGKIHNYFFAKGLDKLREGGLMAYITTDGFLNSPSNKEARAYLFNHANFVSVHVMPDNLMKETGNTEAPNHLLIVQKNSKKESLSAAEELLLKTEQRQNEFGTYHSNLYLMNHPETILGDSIKAGRNQYGQATQEVWQSGEIEAIAGPLSVGLHEGLVKRFSRQAWMDGMAVKPTVAIKEKLTFLSMPEEIPGTNISVQLGLFDAAPAENINRAIAYISALDATVVDKKTARIINMVKAEDKQDHEAIVLVTAKSTNIKQYVYKLYSNVKEIDFPANWMNAAAIGYELKALPQKLSAFDHWFYNDGEAGSHIIFETSDGKVPELKDVNPLYREGTLTIHDNKVGFVSFSASEGKDPVFITSLKPEKDIDFYRQYIAVRDRYLQLDDNETNNRIGNEGLRKKLNEAYEGFTGTYGYLNNAANRQRILKDEAFGSLVLGSLERKESEQYTKADVLTGSVQQRQEAFSTDNPLEALARSLNDRGKVDIEFIATATGQTEEDTIHSLGQHIFLDPATGEFQTADKYLSGNVVAKLAVAEAASLNDPGNTQLQRSLEAIQKVQPEKIPFELLDFNLGERWIPTSYYDRFASQLFESSTSVQYFRSLDSFKVKIDGFNAKVNQEYAVTPKSGASMYGNTLMEHALENTSPHFTYEIKTGDKSIRVPDNEAIQLAHQKIESIRNQFLTWLNERPAEEKKDLETIYNNTFNCYVLREYDGSHQQFPGLNRKNLGIEDLYSSQKNTAWRIVQDRGALVDHEVGLGKTLTMIVAAHEMKRLGIVHKPMIIALKANVNQVRDTFRKAYPQARVLAPGENDFTPAKRERLSLEIKNNNWDCIILTHDQFGKIPQSPEIQKQIFQAELDNIEKDLDTARELGGLVSKSVLKGLETRKKNLDAKLKSIEQAIEEKKDKGLSFRDLGIDHLFVDESHKFKNLTFTTRHNRVAGLGNQEGSQKALNMLFAVRELQTRFNSDLCVTFLSGTPISNSLTEMYLLFKYLRPNEMMRQGIENFDGWAAVFARKSVDFEFSVTNQIIAKERFRHFIKVPELALFYNEVTDYKTAKHINLDKPALDEQLINISPTPDQQAFIKNLMEFAQTGDGRLIGREPLSDDEDKGRMLIATNYAKKMAADMRLINPHIYEDHPNNKVNVCARKIAESYQETLEHRGTQIVFSDIGTPKPDQFNIYDALKEKLVADFNIPAHEITFIHDWTDAKKPELFRKMNSGEIRILMGSTDKAGTGLNVQERMVTMHHIDIPWKPSELEQRNGRGARQGNRIAKAFYGNKVRNYIYAVEQSLDNYKFNLLKNKQTFISQMKNCELHVRTIDEGAMDEKSGMNFSEYIAILSGDTSLLEKSKVEKKIAVLESLKLAHTREGLRARYRLDDLVKERDDHKTTAGKLETDERAYKSVLVLDKEGAKLNPVKLDAVTGNDPEAIGKHLIHEYLHWQPAPGADPQRKIGSLYGFNLFIRRQRNTDDGDLFKESYHNTYYAESKVTGIRYTYNQGHVNVDNPKLAARYFINAIDRVEALKEKYLKEVQAYEKDIPMMQQLAAKPFDKEVELAGLKKELSQLELDISTKIQATLLLQQQGAGHTTTQEEAKVVSIGQKEKEDVKVKQLGPVLLKKEDTKKARGMRM